MFRYYLRRMQYWALLGYQKDMYLVMMVAALLAFFGGVRAAQVGHWWLLPVWMLLLSPIVTYILRRWWEDDWPPIFNHRASKIFMYGDTAVLPVVFGFAGYGWQKVPASTWMRGHWFAIISLMIGIIGAYIFHLVDRQRYIKSGNEAMLYCPTKVWHDMAVFPLTIALLVWLLLPQLITAWSVATVAALTFLSQFILLIVLEFMTPPDLEYQYVKWNKEGFGKIPADF